MPTHETTLAFPIDHIIARQHGGPTALENLALCCGRCNLSKGPNIAGLDPQTRELTRLFDPRRDIWSEHFAFDGPTVAGLTAIGRTTVVVLAMNQPHQVAKRQALIEAGLLAD